MYDLLSIYLIGSLVTLIISFWFNRIEDKIGYLFTSVLLALWLAVFSWLSVLIQLVTLMDFYRPCKIIYNKLSSLWIVRYFENRL